MNNDLVSENESNFDCDFNNSDSEMFTPVSSSNTYVEDEQMVSGDKRNSKTFEKIKRLSCSPKY